MLGFKIAAITVHGRTAKEKSAVPCHWDEIGKAVQVRNSMGSDVLIIGNGDVVSREDALSKVQEYGVDGVMIARGMLEDIQIFATPENRFELVAQDRMRMLREHLDLFDEAWGGVFDHTKNAHVVKKFVKVYIRDYDGAKELRTKIMECETIAQMRDVLTNEEKGHQK